MGYKMQFRRGDKVDLPQLDNGEPGYTEDTNELFIGTKEGNKKLTFDADKHQELTEQLAQTMNDLEQRSINITQPPYNASANGLDVSAILNQAIIDINARGGGKVFIPSASSSYMVDVTKSIQMKDNVTIELGDGATLEAIATDAPAYAIIKAENVKNFSVIGKGLIKGDRTTHIGTTGEWGMGIDMRGCTNVYISDISIENCWGDGLYIGPTTEQNHCKDVTIEKFSLNNNRRQGISVISAINLKIKDGTIKNTNGTPPQDGIDIEPNHSTEYIQNVLIENVVTENNVGAGIHVYALNLTNTKNEVSIYIKNHTDIKSGFAVSFTGEASNIKGIIKIENPKWELMSGEALRIDRWDATAADVIIVDPVVLVNSTTENSVTYPFNLTHGFATTKTSPTLGNIHLYRPKIILKSGSFPPQRGIVLTKGTALHLDKISIIDPYIEAVSSALTDINFVGDNVKNLNVSDKYGMLKYQAESAIEVSVSTGLFRTMYTNNVGIAPNYKLHSNIVIGAEFEFINKDNVQFRIFSDVDISIYPLGTAIRQITSSTKGSRIKLKKISATEFEVTNIVGTWTTA